MTAIQLNADIYRSLGVIAEDESALAKVAKYLRRVAQSLTDDPTEMTKDEYFAKLKRSAEQYERGEYTTMLPGESVTEMLRRQGYDI